MFLNTLYFFNVYIFVGLVMRSVLTLVSDVWCYRKKKKKKKERKNDCYYYNVELNKNYIKLCEVCVSEYFMITDKNIFYIHVYN